MEEEGVAFHVNANVGVDPKMSELQEEFGAIVLGRRRPAAQGFTDSGP